MWVKNALHPAKSLLQSRLCLSPISICCIHYRKTLQAVRERPTKPGSVCSGSQVWRQIVAPLICSKVRSIFESPPDFYISVTNSSLSATYEKKQTYLSWRRQNSESQNSNLFHWFSQNSDFNSRILRLESQFWKTVETLWLKWDFCQKLEFVDFKFSIRNERNFPHVTLVIF